MICKKCNNVFMPTIEIDGKRHVLSSRKYCLSCSPFMKHNTKQIHINKSNNESIRMCFRCKKNYIYKRESGCTMKHCQSCTTQVRRKEIKQKMLNYKGRICQKCGYSKCCDALVFHHISPEKKDFAPSSSASKSWKKIQDELDKCILLCANCHAEIHEQLDNTDNIIKLIDATY